MRLKKGDLVPGFKLKDIYGDEVNLENYRGKKLLISFYRYASCPYCNLRIHQIIQHWDILHSQGLEIIAFFESSGKDILKYAGKQSSPFPLIADPLRVIYKRYGVESSFRGFMMWIFHLAKLIKAFMNGYFLGKMTGDIFLMPADFLVDVDQKIAQAYYGKDLSDHISFEDIEQWLS